MGSISSSTRSGDVDKRYQESIEKYWSLKKSIEDRTVKFLRCVDILESASIHILTCNEKTKGRDIALACDPYTRKLLRHSKVLEEDEKNNFVNEIVAFLEFVSQKIMELQAGDDHHDVTCSTIQEYKKSSNEIEDTNNTVDGPEKILEDFQLQIKKFEEENESFKAENVRLQHLVNSLEESDEEHRKEIKKLRNELQDYEKKNNLENKNQVVALQNKLTNEQNEWEKIIKVKNQKIEGLEEIVKALKMDNELKQNEILKLNNLLEENSTLVQNLTSKHEENVDSINSQHETQISKLSQKATDMKSDIANLLKKHGEELNSMFDEKCAAELKWNDLKDNLNTKFQTGIKLENELRKLNTKLDEANNEIVRLQGVCDTLAIKVMQANDDLGVLKRKLEQKKLDFKQCYDKKLEFEKALLETRDELVLYKEKIKKSERNSNQAYVELEKNVKYKKELETKLNQSFEDKKEIQAKLEMCCKKKNEIDSKLHQSMEKHEMCLNEKEKAEKQFSSLQSKHRTLEMEHKRKMLELETKLSTLERKRRDLEQNLQNCRSENETLSKELTDIKMKRILKVKLFSVRRPNTLSDFEDAVLAMLKSRIDDDVRELKFEQQNNPDDVNKDIDPTIVLCFCGSRIGTDAEKAVEGLILSPKMALVMIHHKDVHALPQQLSERVITGQEFKKLDFITDMAFLRDKGIFPCEINNNSLVKLVNFIKKNGKEYNKY